MEQPPPTRRQREQERHRREILEAAVTVFAAKGFHEAGMQEMAQQAQFGVGTLYRLFPGGKDEIYLALKQRVVEAFEHQLREVLAGLGDPVEQLRGYIRASARVYASHPREMSLYLRETAGAGFDLSLGLPPDLAARYQACSGWARQALEQGMASGRLRPLEIQAALLFLRAVINGFLMRWLQAPQTASLEQTVAQVEEVFLHGVLAPA
ncbi:MAG: TetR/AcrR family transcriptional regulator [Desulfarculus sp.]|nr:TetR/AcrR family transcriptional regulator [Desulfarculus sp.]